MLGYGVGLFVCDVLIGIFEPRDSLFAGYWAALTTQAVIFGLLAYRLPNRTVVHGLLALCFEYLLSAAILHALSLYNITFPPEPLLLNTIHWAITAFALVTGLAIGALLRRRTGGA